MSPYCLRCYAPLERAHGARKASVACGRCGYGNVAVDQDVYWTREVALMRIEWAAKALVIVFVAAIGVGMVASPRIQFGMGQGYAVGFPILAGLVLWQTAEKITRRKPYFRASIFWGTIPLILALPVLIAALWPSKDVPLVGRAIALGIAAVLATGALAVHRLCLGLRRWRDQRILRGQTEATHRFFQV